MKKLRLRKWVKVVLTIMVILISIFVYSKTGVIGNMVSKNNFNLILCIATWFWLFIGQFVVISYIWNK